MDSMRKINLESWWTVTVGDTLTDRRDSVASHIDGGVGGLASLLNGDPTVRGERGWCLRLHYE